VTSWNERELSRHIAQPRTGKTLDERISIASHALVAYGQKVERRLKAKLDPFTARGLHDLGGHAVPRHGVALHDIGRINLHGVIGRPSHGTIGQPMSLLIGALVMPLARTGAPIHRERHDGPTRV
jgi:hypothetical protein